MRLVLQGDVHGPVEGVKMVACYFERLEGAGEQAVE